MQTIDRARQCDRALNRARTPAAMRDAVHARHLVRAELEFAHAMEQLEQSYPVRAALPETFAHRLG